MHGVKKIIFLSILSLIACDISLWVQAKETNIEEVISRMYNNWLSDYWNIPTFKPEKNIRRDEVAKFITIFADTILDQQWEETPTCYTFTDIPEKNNLKNYIIQSCELWYMKWKNNKFTPSDNLTNEQAIAIIIRTHEWILEEPIHDRSKNYYNKAQELKILDWLNISNKKQAITRGEFATLLYKTSQLWRWNTLLEWIGTMITSFIDMLWIKINSHTGISKDFIAQAAVCLSGANTTTETDFNMMGMNFYVKSYRQIRWFEWNQCKIYERTEDAKVTIITGMVLNAISSGATQVEIDEQRTMIESGVQSTIGEDGICLYDTWTLVMKLQKELSGESLPMGDLGNTIDNCTGELYKKE